MRFFCDRCSTQYAIRDDKIGPNGVKIRCRKCGHTIQVRMVPAPAPAEAVVAAPPPGPVSGSGGAQEDELEAVFDRVLRSSPDLEVGLSGGWRRPGVEGQSAAEGVWFVALGQQQVGPLTVEQLVEMWGSGMLWPESLCWREGLPTWTQLSALPELTSVLAQKRTGPEPAHPARTLTLTRLSRQAPRQREPIATSLPRASAPDPAHPPPAAPAPAAAVAPAPAPAPAPAATVAPAPAPAPAATVAPAPAAAPAPASPAPGPTSSPDPESAPPRSRARRPSAPQPDPESELADGPSPRPSFIRRVPRSFWVAAVAVIAVVEAVVALGLWQPAGRSSDAGEAQGQSVAEDDPPEPPTQPRAAIRPSHEADAPPDASPREVAPAPVRPPPPPEPPRAAPTREPSLEQPPRRSMAPAVMEKVAAPAPKPSAPPAPATPADPPAPPDEFEEAFGSGDSRPKLSRQAVMGVVVQNKAAVVRCVNEQREHDPLLSGTLVMRWVVLPGGRTAEIEAATPELRDTHMARCLRDLIKTWTFSGHTGQREPVDFSFKF